MLGQSYGRPVPQFPHLLNGDGCDNPSSSNSYEDCMCQDIYQVCRTVAGTQMVLALGFFPLTPCEFPENRALVFSVSIPVQGWHIICMRCRT